MDTFGESPPVAAPPPIPNLMFQPIAPQSSPIKKMSMLRTTQQDEWKEVSRKPKKVTVDNATTSRIIGRGGCNIYAIREYSGAHIEVEK